MPIWRPLLLASTLFNRRGFGAALLVSGPVVIGCAIGGGENGVDPSVTDDVDVLVWAYGLKPTETERGELARLYQQDLEATPQFTKDIAALKDLRRKMGQMDTLAYVEQWALLNSQLMHATPSGRSTRYAHAAQTSAPGSHRYCASSSVALGPTTRAEFMCGGYRFAVIVDGPRGYPVLSYAPYEAPKSLQRVDWQRLTQRFQIVADPSPSAPIAMRREEMELFISVAPPR